MIKLYKVMGDDHFIGDDFLTSWSLPKESEPGEWMPSGFNYLLYTSQSLVEHLGPNIYEAEVGGEYTVSEDGLVVTQNVRLVKKLNWGQGIARLFAVDCAERVLHIFEEENPEDSRPRKAIHAASEYYNKNIGGSELFSAREQAQAAFWDVVGDAAKQSARAARQSADKANVWVAAKSAAKAAANSFSNKVSRDIRTASWSLVWNMEREWQTKRLFEILYS